MVNTTLDAKRSHGRKKTQAASDVIDELATFDGLETQDARLALRELSEWIAELPEEQRAVVWLKSVEGLESAEIGQILGCSEGAVEQRLVRARQGLRERRNAS